MLVANVFDKKYHRIILEDASIVETAKLKQNYDYSFIVSMKGIEDPEYEVVKKKSSLINLEKGLDEIIASFSATSRNEYRRSERNSELSFQHDIANFEQYYNFYKECENARQWFPVPPDEFRASIVFTSSFKGQLISGMTCYTHGKRLRVGRIFSSIRFNRSDELNNTLYGSAAKRIVVEICRYGIENGYETLDLGGVDLTEGLKSGITKFKLSLGGEVVDVTLGRYMKDSFREELETIKKNGWDIT